MLRFCFWPELSNFYIEGRGEERKKSNLRTKIRKFVFVNLIEAVKHADLDLLNFPFGLSSSLPDKKC